MTSWLLLPKQATQETQGRFILLCFSVQLYGKRLLEMHTVKDTQPVTEAQGRRSCERMYTPSTCAHALYSKSDDNTVSWIFKESLGDLENNFLTNLV